jgi:hypothetical protein
MAFNDYTRLNSFVTHVGETLLMSQLESNLKTYLDWGLLEIGAFNNISGTSSGAYGGAYYDLRVVSDPSYTDGQIWESARKDWVWETGTTYSFSPINISGIEISGTTYGTGDATYGHHYNYPLGRVVLDNAVPTNGSIQVNHSSRSVQVYIADQAPWWDQIQYNSYRIDDTTFNEIGSGNWDILASNRVQLPSIVVEAVSRRTMRPYEMGTVGNFVYQDVLFHILAESRWWRNKLLDIISLEKDRTIWLYDNNLIADVTGYPLDERGMVTESPIMYPTLVAEYRFKKARFYNTNIEEMESFNARLFTGTVRATFEIIMA